MQRRIVRLPIWRTSKSVDLHISAKAAHVSAMGDLRAGVGRRGDMGAAGELTRPVVIFAIRNSITPDNRLC